MLAQARRRMFPEPDARRLVELAFLLGGARDASSRLIGDVWPKILRDSERVPGAHTFGRDEPVVALRAADGFALTALRAYADDAGAIDKETQETVAAASYRHEVDEVITLFEAWQTVNHDLVKLPR